MKGTLNERRSALYLMQIYKLALVEGETPNYDTVTKPFSIEFDWMSFNDVGSAISALAINRGVDKGTALRLKWAFNDAVEELFPSLQRKRRVSDLVKRSSKLHISTKKGPNGLCMATNILDILAIKQSSIWKPLREYIHVTKNKILRKVLLLVHFYKPEILNGDINSLDTSKLSIKIESGAKARLFAIVDWVTQSALGGLHHALFDILKDIPEDGTFDHCKLSKILGIWTIDDYTDKLDFSSLDLSAATDRLPSGLQSLILSKIYTKNIGKLWLKIMTDRDFRSPDKESLLRYNCGQPMGALSSWAMLAITHHLIAKVCINMDSDAKKSVLPQYGVIGDDIALLGKTASNRYSLIMQQLLEVEVNPIKGFTSETDSGTNLLEPNNPNKVLEIAKRIIINGYEITPGNPCMLQSYIENPESFITLINDLNDRGVISDFGIETVTRIANLGYNPKLAIEMATFPPCPARGLGQVIESLNVKSGIIWFSNPNLSLDQITKLFQHSTRKRLLSLIDETIERLINQNVKLTQLQATKTCEVFSQSAIYLNRLIIKQLMNKLDLEKVKIATSSFNNLETVYKLVEEIESYGQISDILNGEPLNLYKISSKPSRLFTKLVKQFKVEIKGEDLKTLNTYPQSTSIINNAINFRNNHNVVFDNYRADYISPTVINITFDE